MVYLPVSHLDRRTGDDLPSLPARLARNIGSAFRVIGAAGRVANAIEARRRAGRADLAILGIEGKFPDL